jgi:hypothetical protein
MKFQDKRGSMNILSKASTNHKTKKSLVSGKYDGGIVHLTPSNISGLGNVCPFASAGCKASCLYTAGFGVFKTVKAGRLRKTRLFFKHKGLFFETLHKDIDLLLSRCKKAGKRPFVRLNGTSDINWGNFKVFNGKNIFQEFPNVNFYDYTADYKKLIDNKESNYVMTFSLKENNGEKALKALALGFNVSAVFLGGTLPKTYLGVRVLDGDKEDLQFLYPKGVIVGLRAKGKARKDTTGFAVDLNKKSLDKSLKPWYSSKVVNN